MKTSLGPVEITMYFCIWTWANAYCLYKLIISQNDIITRNETIINRLPDLRPGWAVLSRLRDVSDVEWTTWKYFFRTSWHFLIIQFIISEICRRKRKELLHLWYIISSVSFVLYYMGIMQLLIIFFQPVMYALVMCIQKKKIIVWIMSISFLITMNYLSQFYYFWYLLENENIQDEEIYILQMGLAWIVVRCISYCIDFIEAPKKSEESSDAENIKFSFMNFLEMLSYVLYLPTLYTGPILLYDDFKRSFVKKNETCIFKMKMFLINICIYVIYILLLDLAMHFIYFLAMHEHVEAIRSLPSIALCGGGLWMGLQFHMKYVITYGIAGTFAKLDNIEPPPTPRCIARIHVYSEMWRYFDVGLYNFLIRYIYKPTVHIIKPQEAPLNVKHKLIASLVTFTFIFLWHGTTLSILVWTILNFIGITLEHLGIMFTSSPSYEKFKRYVLKSDQMEDRFKAVMCTPLLAMSAVSNFFLFGGYDVGKVFFDSFIEPSFLNTSIVAISLYSCCHVSMVLQNVPSRTDKKDSMTTPTSSSKVTYDK